MSIWSHISKLLEALKWGETFSLLFNRLETTPEKRIGFTIAAIALSAKMAKADGIVTSQEKLAFKKIFTILPRDEKHVQYVFELAQKDIAGYEIYAKKISKMLKNKPKLLDNLIEGLLYISISDKIFLSNSILLVSNPLISFEYETPSCLEAALILAIHKDLNARFLFFLSLKAYCRDLIFDCLAVLKSLHLAP